MPRIFTPFAILFLAFCLRAENPLIFHLENDSFSNNDREYTHGLELAYVHNHKIKDTGEKAQSLEFSIGQEIYTPIHQGVSFIIEDERPYASLAYGSVTNQWYQSNDYQALGLRFGMVGPSSGGQDFQNAAHDLLGFSRRSGWNNQIEDEFVLSLEWEHRHRIYETRNFGFIGYVITRLGNLHVDGRLGLQTRIGYNLPQDFGFVDLASVGHPRSIKSENTNHSFYFFADAHYNYVFHNLFLDGNVLANSIHSMKSKAWINQMSLGFALQRDSISLSYSHIFRSKEYKTQLKSHDFGSLSIEYLY